MKIQTLLIAWLALPFMALAQVTNGDLQGDYQGGDSSSDIFGKIDTNFSDLVADLAAIPLVIDEDNFATDSATRPPSQQSVKAYVDTADALKANADGSNLTVPTATTGDSDGSPASTAFVQQELAPITSANSINIEIFGVPTWQLPYDNEDTAFTVGLVVTGGTTSATGRILKDSGTVLTLVDVSGTFTDNEDLTDSGSGDASVNGTATATGPFHDDDTTNATIYSGDYAGETIAQWSLVYKDFATGEWMLCDETALGTARVQGVAYTASTDGNLISVCQGGVFRVRNDAWNLSEGDVFGHGDDITQDPMTDLAEGEFFQRVGVAIDADTIEFDLSGPVYERGDS